MNRIERLLVAAVMTGCGGASSAPPDASPDAEPPDPSVVSPGGLVPIQLDSHAEQPRACWTGAEHLVVWSGTKGLSAILLGPQPEAMPRPIVLGAHAVQAAYVDVACGDEVAVAVWLHRDVESGTYRVRAARIDGTGRLLDPDGFEVDQATSSQYWPAVATDGTDFLIAWIDGTGGPIDELRVRILHSDGTVEASSMLLELIEYPNELVIGFGADEYLIAWQAEGARAMVLDRDGTPRSEPTEIDTNSSNQRRLSVAFHDDTFAMGWVNGALFETAVTQEGVAGPAIRIVNGVESYPTLSFDGARLHATWMDEPDVGGPPGVWMASFAPGEPATSGLVSETRNLQGGAAHSGSDEQILVVWGDSVSGSNMREWISGRRYTTGDVPLDDTPLLLSLSPNEETDPDVVLDGDAIAIAWVDDRERDPTTKTASTMFAVGDLTTMTTPVTVAPSCVDPHLASRPSSFIVACTHYTTFDDNRALVQHVRADGARDGEPIFLSEPATYGGLVQGVAADGDVALVIWRSFADLHGAWIDDAGGFVPFEIDRGASPSWYQAAVTANGGDFLVAALDSNGLLHTFALALGSSERLGDKLAAQDVAAHPAIVSSGGYALAAWLAFVEGGYRIEATRLGPDHAPLDVPALALSGVLEQPAAPSAAFDGDHFWVAWDEVASGGAARGSVRAGITTDGELLSTRTAIADASEATSVVMTQGPTGGLFAVYLIRDTLLGATTRVRGRWIVGP